MSDVIDGSFLNAIYRPCCLARHLAEMTQPQAHLRSLDSRDTAFQEDDQSGRCQEISKDGHRSQ